MDEASGEEWAEIQPDGSLQGEIGSQGGDDIFFIARRWPTSNTQLALLWQIEWNLVESSRIRVP